MNTLRLSVAALLLVLVSGCSLITGTDCHDGIVPALSVQVINAETRQSIVAVVMISGPAMTEVIEGSTVQSDSTFPGSYTVTVEQDGYESWTRSGIEVREDDCGAARTERVEVSLVPTEADP